MNELVKQRGSIKGQLTRFATFADKIDPSADLDPKLVLELKYRKTRIENLWTEFDSVQNQIELLTKEDSMEAQESERVAFENKFYDTIASVDSLLEKINKTPPNPTLTATAPTLGNLSLPTINIPNFDGTYESWGNFKQMFLNLVHDNKSLNDIQKFYYLRSYLNKQTFKLIENLELTQQNYKAAWDLLMKRFENTRLAVHNHIHALFSIQVMQRENYTNLRDIADKLENHLVALSNLGQDTKSWDSIIIYVISNKLDPFTRREWERSVSSSVDTLPTLKQFKNFLSSRCQILETIQRTPHETPSSKIKTSLTVTECARCQFCDAQGHMIYSCERFKGLSVSERMEQSKQKHLCINCLRKGHFSANCKSMSTCRFCHRNHHSLLHGFPKSTSASANESTRTKNCSGNSNIANSSASSEQNQIKSIQQNPTKINTSNVCTSEQRNLETKQTFFNNHSISDHSQILLSTVSIYVFDSTGNKRLVRGLLDAGSQVNLVTDSLFESLNLPSCQTTSEVVGIGGSAHSITRKAKLNIKSRVNSFKSEVDCLILPKITEQMPSVSFSKTLVHIPPNIKLADPDFNCSGEIEMLIGASVFWNLICVGQISLGKNLPILQKSRLGWLVSGPVPINSSLKNKSLHCGFLQNLNFERFWEVDCEIKDPILTKEEEYVEQHFQQNTKRSNDGRFIVSVPIKENITKLGNTRSIALKRFHSLEKRLAQDTYLKQDYVNFMNEYRSQGHMLPIDETVTSKNYISYIPHHPVFKISSNTTKTRVVFDASVKSDTGLSLNDCQHVGPTVQNDIFTILVRFRKHQYVLAADVEKMYRQILLSSDDRFLHRIFWRDSVDLPVVCYELQTVTYGTAAAPYQATRCLKQLGLDNTNIYPRASDAIIKDFYMDDLLTGADTVPELLALKTEINEILSTAGFHLRKWLSNMPQASQKDDANFTLNIEHESKTLGVYWNAISDSITYTINNELQYKAVTKRKILSVIAQIYDPLGLLGPTIVLAKLIVQQLWRFQLSWDESLPHDLHSQWLMLYDELSQLNNLEIPRKIICQEPQDIQLHGFADASERAYGACIYIRSKCPDNKTFNVRLLCARSRVAPIRQITLPRLELCAAVLLAELMQKVLAVIDFEFSSCHYWSDSKIVLCWIKSSSRDWQTFIANRIAIIQRSSDLKDWHYVESKVNPADLISRGVSPSRLANSTLWWDGPPMLRTTLETDNLGTPLDDILANAPEKRRVVTAVVTTPKPVFELFEKYSSLNKLIRVVAWVIRFYQNTRKESKNMARSLTVQEMEYSLLKLVKLAQTERFSKEIRELQAKGSVSNDSTLLPLYPFIDNDSILRVGGRIRFSNYCYDKKHPMILPKKHPLTTLIIRDTHYKNLHCGNQALLSLIRERFWPISGRNEVKRIITNCVICFKVKPKPQQYLMGNLPNYRLEPSPVFHNCGLDYAGPFLIKDKATRGCKLVKAYVCLFICMTSRAIHLELVGSLTTEAFLSCLKRFISRRGKPGYIHSDNATNFLGAYNDIKEMSRFLNDKSLQDKVNHFLTNEGITWNFIPPRAPHFGGSWEAGIKSVKFYLKRVLSNAHLIYENFCTVLVQIEAVLNSRPLFPMSSDPNDFSSLTPGHFLIGRTLTAIPEQNLQGIKENRLSLYQRIELLRQQFWNQWSKEYIAELQTRTKWRQNVSTLARENSLVLIAEDNLPPLRWRLGRIIKLHYGKDGIARVADLKTSNGVVTRPIIKLCVLPLPYKEEIPGKETINEEPFSEEPSNDNPSLTPNLSVVDSSDIPISGPE